LFDQTVLIDLVTKIYGHARYTQIKLLYILLWIFR